MVMQLIGNAYDASDSQKYAISKIQHSGGPHFEKSKNRHRPQFQRFQRNRVTQFGPSGRLVRYKFKI